MIAVWSNWLGHLALVLALAWLAILSQRLGRVTHAAPHYIGLWAAAIILGIGVTLRVIAHFAFAGSADSTGWQLAHKAIPAVGLTVGVVFAWRYWSWLLAERD